MLERIQQELEAGRSDTLSALQGGEGGPIAERWEGEVGICRRSGIPHLTPTLSAPGGRRGSYGGDAKLDAPFIELMAGCYLPITRSRVLIALSGPGCSSASAAAR